MNPLFDYHLHQTRRQFFGSVGLSLGGLGMAMCAGRAQTPGTHVPGSGNTPVHPALPGLPHFAGKAKALIYLHANGAPSQLDLWDYKPNLHRHFNENLPESVRRGQRLSTMTSGQGRHPVAPSKFKFTRHGQCGTWVSELLPHTAKHVDDMCVIKTIHTNAINHDPACTFVMTGSEVPGKASIGSWLAYGLGAETQNLPAFVVFTPRFPASGNGQALFTRMWSSGFLPTRFNGVALRGTGDPVLYVQNPPGVTGADRRAMLDALARLNQRNFERLGDPETQTRIAQYEMAFRMQTSVPELVDLSGETQRTIDMYGPDVRNPGSFAHSALMARRLIERGVRVVQILHRGWDQHGDLPRALKNQCDDTDRGTGALLQDLKQRGMLEDTLVIWGGEFGRTVYSQGALSRENYGRDHHPRNFCMWLAGGGIKGGMTYGETDDFSYNIDDKPCHLLDLYATVLKCLGIDHERLTFRHQGLDQKLTGVEGAQVIPELLA
ncbi:MAG: DUF1501 domain-containing protein [Planctomycetes bacterium]|nr:DUF1501 domain-containing protein [Planctomycetota bacterium]